MFSVFGEKQNPVDQALKIIEKEQKKLNKINEKISKNKINGKNIAKFIAKYEKILNKIESVQSVIYFSPANQRGENYKRLYKAYTHYYETLEDLAENSEVKRHELSNTIGKIVDLCRTMLDVSSSPWHDMSPISSSSSHISPILTQVEPVALSPPLIRGSIERSREARRIKIEMNGQAELQKSLLVIEKDLNQLQEEISKIKQKK